jgi:hypothetical protein
MPAGARRAGRASREGLAVVRCEEGYLCDVCGRDVEAITESDLYLRYVMGEVSPLELPTLRERHVRCNPATAQYINDPAFTPVRCDGPFARDNLDAAYAAEQERLVTRAWRRLQEIPKLGIPIPEYPLPEVLAAWAGQARRPAAGP